MLLLALLEVLADGRRVEQRIVAIPPASRLPSTVHDMTCQSVASFQHTHSLRLIAICEFAAPLVTDVNGAKTDRGNRRAERS